MKLSKTMKDELRAVYSAKPFSVHEEDRCPEEWVRFATKRTICALRSRGLVEQWYSDYPVGGFKAHLTAAGIEVRKQLRAERRPVVAAILAVATGRDREAKRTNSELSDLDAGELREHGARWIAGHGWDEYADVIVRRIDGMTGQTITLREIIRDLEGDVEAIEAGGAYGETVR